MKKLLFLILISFGLIAPVFNANAQANKTSAPIWRVNPASSSINWQTIWAGNTVKGKFNSFNANIKFDPNNLAASNIIIDIPLNGIITPSSEAKNNLPLEDWFDTKKHPNARFESNSVKKTGANTYIAQGFITIKGVKYKLALPFTLNINGKNADMTSSVNLDRINLKLGLESDANAEWVSRTVTVNINLKAQKQ